MNWATGFRRDRAVRDKLLTIAHFVGNLYDSVI
jgi:hypothetical protein